MLQGCRHGEKGLCRTLEDDKGGVGVHQGIQCKLLSYVSSGYPKYRMIPLVEAQRDNLFPIEASQHCASVRAIAVNEGHILIG